MREIEWNGKNIAEGECENKRNFKKFKALQRLASLGENKYFCSLNSTMEFEKKFISFGPTLNLQKGEDQLKKNWFSFWLHQNFSVGSQVYHASLWTYSLLLSKFSSVNKILRTRGL